MISVEHLMHEYSGRRAIDDISFTLRRGGHLCVGGTQRRGQNHTSQMPVCTDKAFQREKFSSTISMC